MPFDRPPSTGRYAKRALVPRDVAVDPRSYPPNDNGAGPNTPPVSVGPTSSEGIGNTNVMVGDAPPVAGPVGQAWSGWPDGWTPPPPGNEWSGYGYGRQGGAQANLSTAVTCIDLNSRELASLPVYGMKGETPFELPAWSENPEPERYSSWAELMMEAVNSLLGHGECFTYVTGRFADGWPSRFMVLPAASVEVRSVDGLRVFSINGMDLDRRDVWFLRYQCIAGRDRGVSPLEWIGSSLLTSGALERYATDLAARGGVPWAAITVPGFMSDAQAKDGRDRWLAARWDSHGAPAMLSGGAEIQTLTLSPKDMALLELREFDERRVCGAFGVPSFLVNVSQASGLTYANATALFDHHWRATLRPLANLIASGWSQFLLPRGSRIEFNPDRYVQPALGERVAAWMTMHGIQDNDGTRAMDVPEIRAAERLGPSRPPSAPPVAELDAQLMTGAAL
jgi:HK97 family phage portal protein